MLGHGPSRVIRDTGGNGDDVLDVLERDVASLHAACAPGMAAPLLGGAVGFLAYEAAARYERLPLAAQDPLSLPRQWFGIFDTVAGLRPCRETTPAVELRAPRRRGRSGRGVRASTRAHRGASKRHRGCSTVSRRRRCAAPPSTLPRTSQRRISLATTSARVCSGRSTTSSRATSSRCRCRDDSPCPCRHIPSTCTSRCGPSTRART